VKQAVRREHGDDGFMARIGVDVEEGEPSGVGLDQTLRRVVQGRRRVLAE
jgi:hypothetical protein